MNEIKELFKPFSNCVALDHNDTLEIMVYLDTTVRSITFIKKSPTGKDRVLLHATGIYFEGESTFPEDFEELERHINAFNNTSNVDIFLKERVKK